MKTIPLWEGKAMGGRRPQPRLRPRPRLGQAEEGRLYACAVNVPHPQNTGQWIGVWEFTYRGTASGGCDLQWNGPRQGDAIPWALRPTPCIPEECGGSSPSLPQPPPAPTGEYVPPSTGGLPPPPPTTPTPISPPPGVTTPPPSGVTTPPVPTTPPPVPTGIMKPVAQEGTVLPQAVTPAEDGGYGPTLPKITPLPTAPMPTPSFQPGPVPMAPPAAAFPAAPIAAAAATAAPARASAAAAAPAPAPAAQFIPIMPGTRFALAPVYPPTGAPMQIERIAALEEGLPPDIEAIISGWPTTPQELARTLIAKYGPPQDACQTQLVWFNNGQWKVTVLYRDGVSHYWPTPHEDYLEQTIDFKVDPTLYDEISEFDGSVTAQRTSGALTARCDYEAANFLAINLARDIAIGEITADEARDIYIEAVQLYLEGQAHPYMQGIIFEIPTDYQGDTDKPVF